MGYARVIISGQIVEVYQYERDVIARNFKHRRSTVDNEDSLFRQDRQDVKVARKPKSPRTESSAKRAALAIRRLILANLSESDDAVFATFTYRDGTQDVVRARADFAAFARRCSKVWRDFRYVCVVEFHKSGFVHLHALLWGVPSGTVERERRSRMVASLWGKGFIDLVQTNNSPKIAWYLSKYVGKTFSDVRLSGLKAYVCSRNLKRPVDDRNAILARYYTEGVLPSLIGVPPGVDVEFLTQWLGTCRYRRYLLT